MAEEAWHSAPLDEPACRAYRCRVAARHYESVLSAVGIQIANEDARPNRHCRSCGCVGSRETKLFMMGYVAQSVGEDLEGVGATGRARAVVSGVADDQTEVVLRRELDRRLDFLR